MLSQSLNGPWQMRRCGSHDWLPASVPGSVYLDLLREGAIPDPFYRDHERKAIEVSEHDYEYRRTLQVSSEWLRNDSVQLVCSGLDTLSTISVNGRELASTDNMFRTYSFEVKPFLREGENELHIRLASGLIEIRRRHAERPVWNQFHTLDGFSQLRKAGYMFGWDWGPIPPDAGIWRTIELQAYRTGKIDDLAVLQRHEDGRVKLQANVKLERLSDGGVWTVMAELADPDGSVHAARADTNHDHVTLTWVLDEPQLWWPNGYGGQPLYELTVSLREAGSETELDRKRLRIGLRMIELYRNADQWGKAFEFVVNSVPIFIKGANYIPEDSFPARQTRERTEKLIRDSAAIHMNLLRVWGGGVYAEDYFYDLCDEYGLIVWQDFMFACAAYALDDPLRETIRREAADQIRRLRHHACLGIWCGNNEIETAWVDWGIPQVPEHKQDYVELFEQILPEQVLLHDPQTPYWPSSPSSGGSFDAPNDPNRGDVHYWDVWHGLKPFTDYRRHHFRFVSEFGFQSFPNLRTIESFTLPEDRNLFSHVMERHQKNDAANGKILYYLSQTFLYPQTFSSLIYASQLLQAEAIKCGVEHWRRDRGRCMGTVYWQLNDCWPVASWSGIDYYGRWKALHYAARRFYAPVLLSIDDGERGARIVVTNDTRCALRGTIHWSVRDRARRVIRQETIEMEIPPLASVVAGEMAWTEEELSADRRRQVYLTARLEIDGAPVSENTVLLVPPKHFVWQDPQLLCDVQELPDRFSITVSASAFAKYVQLDSELDSVLFSDNVFDFADDSPKTVFVSKAESGTQSISKEEFERSLRIRSVYDIARPDDDFVRA